MILLQTGTPLNRVLTILSIHSSLKYYLLNDDSWWID